MDKNSIEKISAPNQDKIFLKEIIASESGTQVLKFVAEQIDLSRETTTVLLPTSTSNVNKYGSVKIVFI